MDPQVFFLLHEEYLSTICFEPGSHYHPILVFGKHGEHSISIHLLHATHIFVVFRHILPCRNTPSPANSTILLMEAILFLWSPCCPSLPFSSSYIISFLIWQNRNCTGYLRCGQTVYTVVELHFPLCSLFPSWKFVVYFLFCLLLLITKWMFLCNSLLYLQGQW